MENGGGNKEGSMELEIMAPKLLAALGKEWNFQGTDQRTTGIPGYLKKNGM